MLTQLKVYHQLFQLTKKQRVKILVQLSELLQKYMIIYVFYMPVLEDQYVQRMGLKLHLKLLSKWWTKLWHIQKKVDYKYLLQLFQVEKENMLSYLMICKKKVTYVLELMARRTILPKNLIYIKIKNTQLKLLLIELS